jgi:hypothetical protein
VGALTDAAREGVPVTVQVDSLGSGLALRKTQRLAAD